MKLKKNQVVSTKPSKVGKEKLHKANDDDGDAESDTQEYLKVSATPNKNSKIPAPEADSEEDDLDVDDEELDDEDDDFGEEGSLDDEELDDEESDGLSGDDDGEVPQLVAAGKPKAKQKVGGKEAAVEGSGDDDDDDGDEEDDDDSNLDDEEEEDDDEYEEEEEEEEVATTKAKKLSKDSGNKGQQAKRKADDGPVEQTSKKSKHGDGIPRSIFMDIDEYDKLFLYVGNLPERCTVEEVKALSPDIISVRMNVKCEKLSFVFVEFKSEKVAERNLKLLQAVKLRGHPLKVGYRGAKRADCPMTWKEVQNELCIYGLPQGFPLHRVARLFPTATQVTTMAFYTLVTFESKEALLGALKNKACHSVDGRPLKFCYRLKAAGLGKKKKIRKKRGQGKLDSKPQTNPKGAPEKKRLKEDENKKKPGSQLFQKKGDGGANAKTSKAKFDAKRKEVMKAKNEAMK